MKIYQRGMLFFGDFISCFYVVVLVEGYLQKGLLCVFIFIYFKNDEFSIFLILGQGRGGLGQGGFCDFEVSFVCIGILSQLDLDSEIVLKRKVMVVEVVVVVINNIKFINVRLNSVKF